ncbi:class Ib ribonucleoside-diphosphate reductase assembly flavoprotein NrdI [Leucobacter sp. OH1287]|nr:class Ib ribonucleoside-diphosphate reductase assembly flavoprotein NrdI [Leucobacter sp. OH1287]
MSTQTAPVRAEAHPEARAAASHTATAAGPQPAPRPRSRTAREIPIREIAPADCPQLVYFSSVSENTRRFVEKLDIPAVRIPLRPHREGMIRVTRPYVLIVPTYGGGEAAGAVPKQVIQFLNDPQNRSLIRGVITAGNTNFGEHFCLAGPIISRKCRVPELFRFELLGTQRDVTQVREGLARFWQQAP